MIYFALERKGAKSIYILRQSYPKQGVYHSRDLFNLGTDPRQYIRYTDDTTFEIDRSLLLTLRQQGIVFDENELEELFYPFLDSYIRYKTEPFRNRHRYRRWTPMSKDDRASVGKSTHIFDRRRLLFLRFGNCPVEVMDKSPTLFRQLLQKSRDQIEQEIQRQEQTLPPREYRNYIFAIFDLQRFFKSRLSRYMPYSLDQEKVDDLFVEQYCLLDRDPVFWEGYERSGRIPDYLLRYLIMYFDLASEGEFLWTAGFDRGRRYRRAFNRSSPGNRMSMDKAAQVFGLSRKELANMTTKEITSRYRKKAHTLHPDKGGDNEQFVELTAAYNVLLRTSR